MVSQTQTQSRVENLVFEKDGVQYLALGNYALDFKKQYRYLGMTKSGQVILGEDRGNMIKRRYGKIYDDKIHAEGSRYIESLPEVEN